MNENSMVYLYDPYVWSEVVITMPPDAVVEKIAEMAGKTIRLGDALEEIGRLVDGKVTFVEESSSIYLSMETADGYFDWKLLRVQLAEVQ